MHAVLKAIGGQGAEPLSRQDHVLRYREAVYSTSRAAVCEGAARVRRLRRRPCARRELSCRALRACTGCLQTCDRGHRLGSGRRRSWSHSGPGADRCGFQGGGITHAPAVALQPVQLQQVSQITMQYVLFPEATARSGFRRRGTATILRGASSTVHSSMAGNVALLRRVGDAPCWKECSRARRLEG